MIDQLYQRQGLVVVSFSSVSLPGMLNYSIAAAKLRHQLLSSEKKNHLPASYSRKHHFRSRNNELSKVSRGHSPGRGQYHDQQWHKNYGVTHSRLFSLKSEHRSFWTTFLWAIIMHPRLYKVVQQPIPKVKYRLEWIWQSWETSLIFQFS